MPGQGRGPSVRRPRLRCPIHVWDRCAGERRRSASEALCQLDDAYDCWVEGCARPWRSGAFPAAGPDGAAGVRRCAHGKTHHVHQRRGHPPRRRGLPAPRPVSQETLVATLHRDHAGAASTTHRAVSRSRASPSCSLGAAISHLCTCQAWKLMKPTSCPRP